MFVALLMCFHERVHCQFIDDNGALFDHLRSWLNAAAHGGRVSAAPGAENLKKILIIE